MYSVVLLVALSGSADVIDLGGRGCKGCSGTVVAEKVVVAKGCTGGHKLFNREPKSCTGCTGGHKLFNREPKSCNGCTGGHKLFNRESKGCTGCTGGSAAPMAEPKKEAPKAAEPKKAA